MTTPELDELIKKYSLGPNLHIQTGHVPKLSADTSGIFFVMAAWSGESIAAFTKLTTVLSADFRDCAVPVVVCDADEKMPSELKDALGRPFGGYGETFWIRNGRIVGVLENYRENWIDFIKGNTMKILPNAAK